MKVRESRQVGDIEIIVTNNFRLLVEDRRTGDTIDITDDYTGQPVDKSIFAEVEMRARSGDLFSERRGRGTLLGFLRS